MERVGFIGLGIMGKPMALHLLKAGYPLTVLDKVPAPQAELVAAGAKAAATPRQVAQESDIIITMLPDSPDVRQVVLGADGVLEGLRAGSLLIDMSTIAPSVARDVAKAVRGKGADALDAPVSGGQWGAEQGTLSIMVGGSAAALERARPVLETMGKTIVHMGDAGAGQVTKAANQIVCAVEIAVVSEALVMASKAGVDPAKVREALLGGAAQSAILKVHGERMIAHNFKPGFRARLHHKDLGIALQIARELGVSLPTAAAAAEMFNALLARGGADLDNSALVTVLEDLAQHQVGGKNTP